MKAPAQFLRRPKNVSQIAIDKIAVALAHHRLYCLQPDRETCTQIDEDDMAYAEQLVEVLDLLPEWPDGR